MLRVVSDGALRVASSSSRPGVYFMLTSSSLVIIATVLQWRARKRARKTVERLQDDVIQNGGPLVSEKFLAIVPCSLELWYFCHDIELDCKEVDSFGGVL
jgi:high-affinity nickel permease